MISQNFRMFHCSNCTGLGSFILEIFLVLFWYFNSEVGLDSTVDKNKLLLPPFFFLC